MTEYPAIRDPERCPTHPGELLREDIIPATGRSKVEIARMLGISRQPWFGSWGPILPEKHIPLGSVFERPSSDETEAGPAGSLTRSLFLQLHPTPSNKDFLRSKS